MERDVDAGRAESAQPDWRQAFPIDVPQDHYVGRRDFLKFLGLTSLAFVVGQFWIALRSLGRSRQAPPGEKALADLRHLPVGGTLHFDFPGEHDACLLLRPDEKTVVAYSQKCTHLSCAVMPDLENGCLNCPCHHGVFDLQTGRPIAGPPRRPLTRIALEVRDSIVYATRVELRTV